MSQSLEVKFMTELFKIQGYCVKDINFDRFKRRILIDIEKTDKSNCPSCLFPHNRYDSTFQDILVGVVLGRPVYVRLKLYRIECPVCGILTEEQTISDGKKRYSKSMGYEVIRYTEFLDTQSVSKLLGLSQSTVYRIDRDILEELMGEYREEVPSSSVISVDEVSYKKGHKYATVITNYEDAHVLWLEKGRKSRDLKRAYHQFGNGVDGIKTVAMDFWAAYERATRKVIPEAQIVFDRFHLSRILNRKLEDERRKYQNQLSEDERKMIKKQCRWLILKRKSRLNEDNLAYLEKLKKENEPLYDLYLLKEDFLDIFQAGKKRTEAKEDILKWVEVVLATKYKKLKQFARSIIKRLDTILNWFDVPISNAKSEGINNVIKTLLKRAYGYRDFDYFRMKTLQKCGYLMKYLPGEI